ncbi:pectinesterase family protein [Streptomyces sp. NPDC000618]|uniref:pectinesterase family protein n=1 Tax=Streptomyces sp. NPDC000618 TaxID=3154265 RepID=UPI003319A586
MCGPTERSLWRRLSVPDLRVQDLTIQNTFDPTAHPEVDPFATQAVALAATGDRQAYSNVRLISTQDTVLTKSPAATDQTRHYFRNCYVAGDIDLLFGNATAVFDRSTLHVWPHTAARSWRRTPTKRRSTVSSPHHQQQSDLLGGGEHPLPRPTMAQLPKCQASDHDP